MASASSQELDVVKFIGRPLKSFTRRSHKAQQLCGGWVQSTVSHMMRQAHPIQQSNIVSHAIVVSVPGHRHPYSRLDSHHTRTNQQLLYTPLSSNITCRLNANHHSPCFLAHPTALAYLCLCTSFLHALARSGVGLPGLLHTTDPNAIPPSSRR